MKLTRPMQFSYILKVFLVCTWIIKRLRQLGKGHWCRLILSYSDFKAKIIKTLLSLETMNKPMKQIREIRKQPRYICLEDDHRWHMVYRKWLT